MSPSFALREEQEHPCERSGAQHRIVAAAILLQTLHFKFTGAPESVYIFTKVGAEPMEGLVQGWSN